jgi:hypothetical protein
MIMMFFQSAGQAVDLLSVVLAKNVCVWAGYGLNFDVYNGGI